MPTTVRSGLDHCTSRRLYRWRADGEYKQGFAGSDNSVELQISRSDVADFILRQLNEDIYLRKAPGISY